MNKKTRILVLEDDRTSRKLLTWILEQAGYNVIECSEGRDAIHMAIMNPPKVIVVDVMLPDMCGTEVVEELKNHPACRHIKSIFLTGILTKKAKESDSDFRFNVDGRAYRALAKPVRKSVLLRLLDKTIAEADAAKLATTTEEKNAPLVKIAKQRADVSQEEEADTDEAEIQNSPLW